MFVQSSRARNNEQQLGLALHFLWGSQVVGEYFLHPHHRPFRVGTGQGVDFAMGDVKFNDAAFELVQFDNLKTTLRFTSHMTGEFKGHRETHTLSLDEVTKRGLAITDGKALALTLEAGDVAKVDLGGIVVLAVPQSAPPLVSVPLSESLDYTLLNTLCLTFGLAAFMAMSAVAFDEDDSLDDEPHAPSVKMAHCLIKPSEPLRVARQFPSPQPTHQLSAGHSLIRPKRPKPSPSAPQPKAHAQALIETLFAPSGKGVSALLSDRTVDQQLKTAMSQLRGPPAQSHTGGLMPRGNGSGGVGTMEPRGIEGLQTRGRAGHNPSYGANSGLFSDKQRVDPFIASSNTIGEGALDKELIRKVIRANRGQIRFCYESQLNRFPNLSGKIAVKFIISATGAVKDASITQSTLGNEEIEKCVASRVRQWQFPKPQGGGVVTVTYPFLLTQSGQVTSDGVLP